MNMQIGDVGNFPIIESTGKNNICDLVKENIEICKDDWDSFETSWDFKRHPLL
jgi:hypothetical protein